MLFYNLCHTLSTSTNPFHFSNDGESRKGYEKRKEENDIPERQGGAPSLALVWGPRILNPVLQKTAMGQSIYINLPFPSSHTGKAPKRVGLRRTRCSVGGLNTENV